MDRVAIRQGLVEELAFLETHKNPRAEQVRAALANHDAIDAAEAGEDAADEVQPAAMPETAESSTPLERAVPRKARKDA